MTRKLRGIPTLYKGTMMRSRLEAKYAAFFDELGWPWRYEPFDLQGYIPDYLLEFWHGGVLFEVKGIDEELDGAKRKIEFSGWTGDAIVATGEVRGAFIGAFLEQDQNAFVWGDAELFFCLSCGMTSVLAANGSWRCRACGEGGAGGNEHVGNYDPADAWARATNRVQWRPGT